MSPWDFKSVLGRHLRVCTLTTKLSQYTVTWCGDFSNTPLVWNLKYLYILGGSSLSIESSTSKNFPMDMGYQLYSSKGLDGKWIWKWLLSSSLLGRKCTDLHLTFNIVKPYQRIIMLFQNVGIQKLQWINSTLYHLVLTGWSNLLYSERLPVSTYSSSLL